MNSGNDVSFLIGNSKSGNVIHEAVMRVIL